MGGTLGSGEGGGGNYVPKEQVRIIERELRSVFGNMKLLLIFLLITSFVIAYLIKSVLIVFLITSFVIAYLITSYVIAIKIKLFVPTCWITSFVIG